MNATDTREDKLPTIKQMVNRSNSGHHAALRDFAAQGAWSLGPDATITMGTIRGARTVIDTLSRWQCTTTTKEGEVLEQTGRDSYRVIQKGKYVTRLTERGVALLAALDAREAASRTPQPPALPDTEPF